MPKARVRPRTRRRELQRWGLKHAEPFEVLNAALEAAVRSVQALTAVPDDVERIQRATAAVKAFLAAVETAQALPAAPDPAAQEILERALTLWRDGAALQLASMHPLRDEESERAADLIARGTDELARFALTFAPAAVA